MTTQAKYGWATGLIVMGILFSLPFRHQGDRNTGTGQELASAVPSDEKKSKAVNGKDGTQPENPPATRTGADSDRALKSSLLPETSPAMREALAPKTSQPVEIVEEVPSRFRPEDIRPGSTPMDHSGPSGHLRVESRWRERANGIGLQNSNRSSSRNLPVGGWQITSGLTG